MKKGDNSEKKYIQFSYIFIQVSMLKFQTPMLNDEVLRAMTDKQTHKQTYIPSKN